MRGISPSQAPMLPTLRSTAVLWLALALVAGVLVLGEVRPAQAQTRPECEVIDLGALGPEEGAELVARGQWTTEECDSLFRAESDAVVYRFELTSGGRIRVGLSSSDADSHLALFDEDGGSLAGDDDGGGGVDSLIERDLRAGTYLVEATTIGGRVRGAADFELTITRVGGCEAVSLGALESGSGLTAKGAWTPADCGGSFFARHPAHTYSFEMAKGGRVRIDLVSEDGDPFLTLRSPESGLVEFNDDGGPGYNSRLELHLSEGTYVVEATTWGDRSRVPAFTDFELTIRLVGHDAYSLKVEQVIAPDRVIANQPFTVHYRVGNVGGGDLPDTHNAKVRLYAPRVRQVTDPLEASDGYWQASSSYHSGVPAAGPTSVTVDELAPFEVTLSRHGPSWVYVLVDVHAGREHVASQGIWRNLTVLSGPTFDPATVTVDGYAYRVSAEDTGGGEVEVSVESPADPDAEIESSVRAKAIYAAGVRTQVLDGILERPAIAAIRTGDAMSSDPADEEAVVPASPTSNALITAFAENYSRQISASGLAQRMAAGELVSRRAAESLVHAAAGSASEQYRDIESSWVKLQQRMDDGGMLSFAEALKLQAQLAYAERILSPAVEAGDIVTAATIAEDGWEDEAVEAMVADLAEQASCRGADGALGDALASAGITGIDHLLALEAELRAVLPLYGIAGDGALCRAAAADHANSVFLGGLTIAKDSPIPESESPESTEPPPPTLLRIVARVGDDGRIEHAVELPDGERILPERRFLPADARPGRWSQSSDVELDGVAIGQIRTRRMADGRVELGFRPARGEPIVPVLRYLPSDAPTGVWLRSSEIEVPHPGSTLEL